MPESSVPDFAIFAAEGFNFNSQDHQADHGGLRTAEVRTTFIAADLGHPFERKEIEELVFTRNITPAMLDYLGYPQASEITQGKSLRNSIQKANPQLEDWPFEHLSRGKVSLLTH